MTREELARNIERRPSIWERYAAFLDVLPSSAAQPVAGVAYLIIHQGT
jgi:hypothetical protein